MTVLPAVEAQAASARKHEITRHAVAANRKQTASRRVYSGKQIAATPVLDETTLIGMSAPLAETQPTNPTDDNSVLAPLNPLPTGGTQAVPPIELQSGLTKTDNYNIDLAAVLQLVEDQNLTLASSKKNTEVIRSRYRQSQAALLPNITASYSNNSTSAGQQQGTNQGGQPIIIGGGGGNSGKRISRIQPQLSASWTLYPGGRQIYQILAAKRRDAGARLDLKTTYQDQLSQAAQQYYQLLAAYLQKGVVLRNLEDLQEQVNSNQLKVKVGTGIPLDLSRARTSYAQQQTALVQADTTVIIAEQALLNRLNLDPTIHLVPTDTDAIKKGLVPVSNDFKGLLASAIATNPQILSIDQTLKALGDDYKVTRSDLVPSVTLSSYISRSGDSWADGVNSNSVGLSISSNLLQNLGFTVPLQMREKKQLIEQKAIDRQALVRDVQSSITTAYLNSQNYESAILSSQQEVESAQESYDLAVGRFKSGYGINLDVLDAQLALATARSNLVQATLNYDQAQVQLVQALGQVRPATLLSGLPTQPQGTSPNGQKAHP